MSMAVAVLTYVVSFVVCSLFLYLYHNAHLFHFIYVRVNIATSNYISTLQDFINLIMLVSVWFLMLVLYEFFSIYIYKYIYINK